MLLFGYAVTLDVKKVSMAVLDRDRSQESLNFIQRFSASPISVSAFGFRMKRRCCDSSTRRGEDGVDPSLDFSKTIKAEKMASVQALIDGADANTASLILSYAQAISRQYTQEKTILKVTRLGMQNLSFPVMRGRGSGSTKIWNRRIISSRDWLQ